MRATGRNLKTECSSKRAHQLRTCRMRLQTRHAIAKSQDATKNTASVLGQASSAQLCAGVQVVRIRIPMRRNSSNSKQSSTRAWTLSQSIHITFKKAYHLTWITSQFKADQSCLAWGMNHKEEPLVLQVVYRQVWQMRQIQVNQGINKND